MKSRSLFIVVLLLGLVASACDSGAAELSTTSSLVTGTTETPTEATSTTAAPSTESSTTEVVGETVSSAEVKVRISADNGEILYILIPEGAYTDVDLENFIGDLKEADPDLWGAEVFDDEAAIEAFVIPEDQRTTEQQELIDDHHFVSLVEGDTVKFQGPFSYFGEFIIGS